ncbi:MAG: polymer-forming cytoskeletal protein [Thermoanaerobacteraceae bacterium]|nr:polymer-forming cytoskeletal protein [Thermoanaerobacteraceae bacterium]
MSDIFEKKKPVVNVSSDRITTLIGHETSITGSIKSDGILRIDGKVDGGIEATGDVILGEKSIITGDIKAVNAVIAGELNGNITCSGTVSIESSGKVFGDIESYNLRIVEGAVIEGRCSVKKEEDQIVSVSSSEEPA